MVAWSVNSISCSSLPGEWRGGAESSKLLIRAWSLWWPFLIWGCLGDPQSSHQRNKDTHPSGDSKDVRSSCVRNWGRRPNIRTKDAPRPLSTWEIARILGAVWILGAKTKHVSYYTTVVGMFIFIAAIGYVYEKLEPPPQKKKKKMKKETWAQKWAELRVMMFLVQLIESIVASLIAPTSHRFWGSFLPKKSKSCLVLGILRLTDTFMPS